MAMQSVRTLRQKTVPLRPSADDARLQQIEDEWQQYPGRAPGGTGLTGLLPNDSRGYSDMLNEQTEYANLLRRQKGQGPLQVVPRYQFDDDRSFTAGDALAGVERSMPWYVPPPKQPQQQQPAAPQGPQAPAAPPPPKNRGQLKAQDVAAYTPAVPSQQRLDQSASIGALRRGTLPYYGM